MKRNGFVFVETIVAIVILASSLLLLYSSFNKILQSEKIRVYYDDVNYIYRTWYIKDRINDLNMMAVLRDIISNEKKYFVTVGSEYEGLFTDSNEKNYINKITTDFDVTQMIIFEENKLNDLKKCTLECSLNNNCYDSSETIKNDNCTELYTNLSDEMINYLKSIDIDIACSYIFVAEYRSCNSDNTNCKNFYSWVSV